ncbi:LamG-like jellyroll fold domain-containing protein [Rariglobus hedericola]|uniref:LamG domain-containing protein n=1 Tax=Rariglobus hedericola TaxID=2597822 RepID=A0A556QRQ2_9BACT|nr:LamG-like jellyroll fold domain-containing protein [Rariglobus hedericola]TSJ79320.1 LamG domain-containing protein [Rariglobus hedericola]
MKSTALLPFLALFGTSLSAQSAPLLSWNFNEGGGAYTANLGSAGDANLYTVAVGGDGMPFFSADAKGVSEKTGDYALDLTSATGMGATTPNSTGPAAVVWSNSTGLSALSGLSSFTLTGWINPAVPLNASARIVVAGPITLMAGTEDRLSLQVNGTHSDVQSEPSFNKPGAWIFFAAVYDGTRTTDNVTYYVATTTPGTLTVAGTTTIAAGKLKPFSGQFLVGNNATKSATTRPFKGLIDNLAVHGAKDDASGALTKEKIEAIRAAATR